MVMDNRYFPWIPHLYTGSDHTHSNLNVEGFFITGGDAYRYEDKANKEEQIISYPELYGQLKITDVANSMIKAGLKDPIPADWRWNSEIKARMNGSLEGQGVMVAGYKPVNSWFGVGGSVFFMRINAMVNVVPDEDTVRQLFLNAPGNQAEFTRMLDNMYNELCINCTTAKDVGAGDVVVYCNFYDVQEYRYKVRKLDYGCQLGIIIPSGLKQDPNNLASLPFGGNGLFGWFVAPYVETELKEDFILGAQARVTQRFDNEICGRIPVGKEQPLFGPIVGNVYVDSGVTVSASIYGIAQEIRAGLGIQAQYTATYHDHDNYSSKILNSNCRANFFCKNAKSEWVSSYGTVRLMYDVGHDRSWDYRPLVTFTWDIPTNHVGGKGFAKTHRISLGCTINF